MSIKQTTPFPNLTIAGNTSDIIRVVQGQRITITNLVGASSITVAVDGGPAVEIAPGYPLVTGLETFQRFQFINNNVAQVTFNAEIGWEDRPDYRGNISQNVNVLVQGSIALNTAQMLGLTNAMVANFSTVQVVGSATTQIYTGTGAAGKVVLTNVGGMTGPGGTAAVMFVGYKATTGIASFGVPLNAAPDATHAGGSVEMDGGSNIYAYCAAAGGRLAVNSSKAVAS